MPKRTVMIKMHTVRTGLSSSMFDMMMEENGVGDGYDGEENDGEEEEEYDEPEEEDEEGEESDEPDEYDLMMEGRLVTGPDRVGLLYEESELTGMPGSTTTISFSRENPGLISMLRSGPVNTALVFEKGKRHFCLYHTPFSDFEVCVSTREVENKLLTEGKLHLVYAVEIHGARAELTDLTIDIS